MELSHVINLTFIFALNVLFFFSGICLNSLVIISFWRNAKLRKKLCYFMIMVLSCCDLLVVLTTHPTTAVIAFFWLTGKANAYPSWVDTVCDVAAGCLSFPILALLVMNFDRYLATHHPLFHRTSVTKRKLSTLLAILISGQVAMALMCVNDFAISRDLHALIMVIIIFPSMMFFNYKLFIIARKSRRKNGMTPDVKKTFCLKNTSRFFVAVVCFVVLFTPATIHVVLKMASKETAELPDGVKLVLLWSKTSLAMNSTFNCIFFYWKNKILRAEGTELIKSIKIRRFQIEH